MLACSREEVYMSVLRSIVRLIRLNRVNYSFALDQQKTLLAAARALERPQVEQLSISLLLSATTPSYVACFHDLYIVCNSDTKAYCAMGG